MSNAITVISPEDQRFEVEFDEGSVTSGQINGNTFTLDLIPSHGGLHLIRNNKSYKAHLQSFDADEKSIVVKVNGNKYEFQLKDRFDALLEQMGMDNLAGSKVAEVKAPMPGLVLDIMAQEGMEVKKGDALIILEAMKMENVIKSPADGVVSSVSVNKSDSVEKNQLLLSFA